MLIATRLIHFVTAYLYLIFRILKQGWESRSNDYVFGGLLALIALAIVHFFTPYLNHPLGIAYIILAAILFNNFRKKIQAEKINLTSIYVFFCLLYWMAFS